MAKIFISHSSKDKRFTVRLAADLKELRITLADWKNINTFFVLYELEDHAKTFLKRNQ